MPTVMARAPHPGHALQHAQRIAEGPRDARSARPSPASAGTPPASPLWPSDHGLEGAADVLEQVGGQFGDLVRHHLDGGLVLSVPCGRCDDLPLPTGTPRISNRPCASVCADSSCSGRYTLAPPIGRACLAEARGPGGSRASRLERGAGMAVGASLEMVHVLDAHCRRLAVELRAARTRTAAALPARPRRRPRRPMGSPARTSPCRWRRGR